MEGKIYEAISAVMNDIGAVGKNSTNQHQGFKFRGVDAVMNALHPALSKHKVFIAPEVLEQSREERQSGKGGMLIYSICKIRYTFYAEDGSNISAVVVGEGMDSGDKATNKAMAIAFKYACFQVFCIPTEEMAEPDSECHEIAGKKQNITPTQKETINKGGDFINAEQLAKLKAELDRTGVTEEKILETAKAEKLEEIKVITYTAIMNKLSVSHDKE
jgi:hypothetical protein